MCKQDGMRGMVRARVGARWCWVGEGVCEGRLEMAGKGGQGRGMDNRSSEGTDDEVMEAQMMGAWRHGQQDGGMVKSAIRIQQQVQHIIQSLKLLAMGTFWVQNAIRNRDPVAGHSSVRIMQPLPIRVGQPLLILQ